MSFCKGENCVAEDDVPHSIECRFEHFMSYSGVWQLPEYVKEELFEIFKFYEEHKSELA